MPKKMWVLISVLAAALLLTLGGATMVMAEAEEETTPPPAATGANGLLERVADILEIDREELIDAFKQARQEMTGDSFIDRLRLAVEEGLITQQQADEIIEWREQRPEGMEPGIFQHNRRSHLGSGFGFHPQHGPGAGFCPGLPGEAD